MSYQKISFTENVSLSFQYPYVPNTYVICDINEMEPGDTDTTLKVYLPSLESTGNSGRIFIFKNISTTKDFDVTSHTGSLIVSIKKQTSYQIYSRNDSWGYMPFGMGIEAIQNINFESESSPLTITPPSVTTSNETVKVGLNPTLDKLGNLQFGDNQGCIYVGDNQNFNIVNFAGSDNISVNYSKPTNTIPTGTLTISTKAALSADTFTTKDSSNASTTVVSGTTITTKNSDGATINTKIPYIYTEGLTVTDTIRSIQVARGGAVFSASSRNLAVNKFGCVKRVTRSENITNGRFDVMLYDAINPGNVYLALTGALSPYSSLNTIITPYIRDIASNNITITCADLNGVEIDPVAIVSLLIFY